MQRKKKRNTMPRCRLPKIVGSFYDNWEQTTRTYHNPNSMIRDIKDILHGLGPNGISHIETKNQVLRKKVNDLIAGEYGE